LTTQTFYNPEPSQVRRLTDPSGSLSPYSRTKAKTTDQTLPISQKAPAKYTSEQDEMIVRLRETDKLTWDNVSMEFSKDFGPKSAMALRLRYQNYILKKRSIVEANNQ
jgi:hypothetical protein